MNDKAKVQELLGKVKENDVRFVKFFFTDVLGFLKGFTITREELEHACYDGMGFDGSSIEGFARIDESDMVAVPDPDTFQILPWRPQSDKVGRLFCDIKKPGGEPFEGDPRYILKRNLERAKKMGYNFYVGPELEFFLFKNNQGTDVLDKAGYFDMMPRDEALDHRRQMVLILEAMGIKVEYSHHEVAPSQHEIDLRYNLAEIMADDVMTYRHVVKEVATMNGVYATFMPKPIEEENGSGMHVHMSLFEGNKNAFFDANDKWHLSTIAKQFIAGLLKHAREITAVTNQWVNSYKRLVPGYEAPVYSSWALRNRSDLVRIPMYKPGNEKATRVEYRSPDPACNPYLTFAVLLAAGLEGIENNYKLQDPTVENIYKMPDEERIKREIEVLPGDLLEAIHCTEKSDVVRKALGDHTFERFIENKKIEWNRYRRHVTPFEMKEYLPRL